MANAVVLHCLAWHPGKTALAIVLRAFICEVLAMPVTSTPYEMARQTRLPDCTALRLAARGTLPSLVALAAPTASLRRWVVTLRGPA